MHPADFAQLARDHEVRVETDGTLRGSRFIDVRGIRLYPDPDAPRLEQARANARFWRVPGGAL
jgi:hypothetical protein